LIFVRLGAWTAVATLFFALAGPAAAQVMSISGNQPFDIRASQISFDRRRNIYEARGKVEIKSGTMVVQADYARVYMDTRTVHAEGNVVMLSPKYRLSGEKMFVNLRTRVAKAYKATLFLPEKHFYLHGDQIEKTSRNTFRVMGGSFTSCDGPRPVWKFTSRTMKVTVDGYGWATHSAFFLGRLPVFYTPLLVFPAKTTRQSGFLMPSIGSSTTDGTIISIPFFINLSNSQDLTIFPTWMTNRGLMLGLEYRYELSPKSYGIAIADYMFNDQVADELYRRGNIRSPYKDRYWFRYMGYQQLFPEVQLKMQIDWASDPDFLREFGNLPEGFAYSYDTFRRRFGLTLDPKYSTTRTSFVGFTRTWERAQLTANFRYYDNLNSTQHNRETTQILPTINFDFSRQPLGKSPFYFQLASAYTHYYRQTGSRGQVVQITPTINLPVNIKNILEFDFSFAPRFDMWWLSGLQDRNLSAIDHREIYTFTATVSSYIFRIFNLDWGSLKKVKHALKPSITYTYRRSVNPQVAVPGLVGTWQKANTITYSLTQTLTAKRMTWDTRAQKLKPNYDEFLKLTLSQSYDVDEASRDPAAGTNSRPFSAISATLQLFPQGKYLQLEAGTAWNPYDSRFTSFNTEISLSSGVGDSLSLDYRYTYGGARELTTRLIWTIINKRLVFRFYNRHSFEYRKSFETIWELEYTPQCWGIRLVFSERPGDRTYMIVFALQGFGEVGGYTGRIGRRTTEGLQ
jgi:LPS-assembly protein